MRIEHFALQTADPVAMSQWYVTHFRMTVARSLGPPTHTFFLADEGGAVLFEIYRNDSAPLPDYPKMDPLLVHLAFRCDDLDAAIPRLLDAGATVATALSTTPAGDELAMLRDPWGLAVQLVKRKQPMLF